MFREFPTTMDECFKSPIEGALYAECIDKLRATGAIQPSAVDGTALVHTFWDLGSPINTVVLYVQIVGAEIRVIDCHMDLDLTPTERVARILAKGYNYGLNFLPHDAAATMKSGRTFQGELHDLGLRNTRIVPRTMDIWIGINHLRELLPRFTFRIPACERALEMLQLYHTRRETSSGLAIDEPVHDFSSHVADCARLIAEAHMAGLLHSIASKATYRRPLTVKSGFRGDDFRQEPDSILDRFFARPRRNVRVIR